MLKLLMISMLLTAPALAQTKEDGTRERRICKRELATGSNARHKRICLTKAEWEQSKKYNRQTTQDWADAIDGAQRSN